MNDIPGTNLGEWSQKRSAIESGFQSLVATIQADLKEVGVCEIAFDKTDPWLRHLPSGILYAKINLIDGTVGLLPRKKDNKEIAPYHSVLKWISDPLALSDIRYAFDFRSKDILAKWKILKVPNLFPVKTMS